MSKPAYVVLHVSNGPLIASESSLAPIASKERFVLTEDMWIERLNTDSAKLIIRACEPAHHNIDREGCGTGIFMHLFATSLQLRF
jgi:hypothetical protein